MGAVRDMGSEPKVTMMTIRMSRSKEVKVIPLLWLVSGQTWETNYGVFAAWVGAWRHNLSLFMVIPFLWLITGQAWEAHFDAIYGNPALGTSWGGPFLEHVLSSSVPLCNYFSV